MKKIIRLFTFILSFFITILFSLIVYGDIILPDKAITINSEIQFFNIYSAEFDNHKTKPVSNINKNRTATQTTEIKLFGAIPVKSINLEKTERKQVILGGEIVGIKLKTDGVLVVGTQSFNSDNGSVCPAEKAGLVIGDTLVSIDKKKISLNSEISEIFAESDGKEMVLEIIRDGKEMTLTICPEKDTSTGLYKGGLWIRDSTGGIGTLTYTDVSNGEIAALGHGIYDVDTGKLMPAQSGKLVSANLSGITKGTSGTAGELRGSLGNEFLGEIILNCENGIYGQTSLIKNVTELIPVATEDEIKPGKAQIVSTVQGNEKCRYDIEIERININDENKNMIIKVIDEDLLTLTGGIVQGMSGSPILQNGQIVGAVTHVFLNDPTKGYGIFIENMMEAAG